MNSKGEIEKKIVIYSVIGAVTIIVLGLILKTIYEQNTGVSDKQMCKDSIMLYSKTAMFAGRPISQSIKCPTRYLKLPVEDNKDVEAAKKEIASQMYDCWDNFGRGKLELFDPKNGRFCVVCAVISFSSPNKKIDGFVEYLNQNRIPGRNETYAQFLGNSEEVEFEQGVDKFEIDTSKVYAVMLTYDKRSRLSTLTKATTGFIVGAAASVAGVALIMSGIGAPVGIGVLAAAATIGGTASAVIASQTGAENSEWTAGVILEDENSVADIGCDYIVKTNELH